MKFCKLLEHYFRGVRVPAVIVSAMLSITIFIGVITSAQIHYLDSDYAVIKSCTLKNAYYFERIYALNELVGHPNLLHLEVEEAIEAFRDDPAVEHIYTTQTVNPLSYREYRISIVLFDPALIEAFPNLRRLGYKFDENPEGCILGSKIFNSVSDGEMIELSFSGLGANSMSFAVNGHIKSPYKHMAFTNSSTSPTAAHLFSDGQSIIMQATETVIQHLSDVAEMRYNPNYIIDFSENATPEQIKEIIGSLEQKGLAYSIEELTERTEKKLSDTLKESIPRPVFLLLAATVAYLSMQLLIIRNKGKELSVYYLCGMSRAHCSLVALIANCIIALPAFILNSVFVLLAPHYDWLGAINLNGLAVSFDDFSMIVGYYLLTVAVSILATYSSMAWNTPLTYLRGVES